MFRLLMAVAFVLLLWIQSLFTHTIHIVDGTQHVFCYGLVAWGFMAAFVLLVVGFAVLAWKWLNDRVGAMILLVFAPLMGLVVLPQILYERVELTDTEWRNRREWPHNQYSADVSWNEIASVTKVRHEDKSFGQTWRVGYDITLRDGRTVEFPSGTVMTAAELTVDDFLKKHAIPTQSRDVLVPPAN